VSYQELKRELDRKSGEVNGKFGDYDWVPRK
jgi:trehalose-6-phosphate synthase